MIGRTTGATGIGLVRNQNQNQNLLKKSFEKLSTGKKINRASDDAAMLSIAKELEKQVRGFKVAESNIGDAMSALRTADGAAGSINNMIQRQRELALQASNGTLNAENRQALNAEFQQLSQEIDRVSKSTQFNTQGLLDGSSPLSDGSGEVQVGTGTEATDRTGLPGADLRSSTLGLDGLDISDPNNISAAISALDNAANQVNSTRTSQGSTSNRLEHAQNNAANTRINTAAALSQAEDLDFAEGVAEQARASLLSQSSQAALQNFHHIAKNNLSSLLQ